MNEYELVSIVHPRLNADETAAAIAAVQGQIEANGGEMLSTDVWGRRRLAYPINHLLEGTYVLMTFRVPPAGATVLEAWLRISEQVIRHLLVRGIIPFQGHDRRDRDREERDDRERDRGAPATAPDAEPEPEAAVADAAD